MRLGIDATTYLNDTSCLLFEHVFAMEGRLVHRAVCLIWFVVYRDSCKLWRFLVLLYYTALIGHSNHSVADSSLLHL